jgi:TRAP-type mannitol/chloroaromatic compound transport system substrate-binding protein
MKQLLKGLMIVTLALGLTACGEEATTTSNSVASDTTATAQPEKTYKWKLITSWPKNFPGLGTAPENFAKLVDEMSNGRMKIKVYGAGEIVPGFAVFDSVANGTAQMGHAAAYYWKGKMPAAQIFTAIPFGMNVQEMNAWLHHGGGLKLWQELYEPFGLVPMPGGSTGNQMAGWFKKEINTVEDFKGLKMRIPGLAGEVIKKLGGLPVSLSGGELFTALQTGAIDATEWVGPSNDLAFGFYKIAKFYYFSPWHEPGSTLEFLFNKEALEELPKDLQAIMKTATRAINQDMLDEYTAQNNQALELLVNKHNVQLRKFSPQIMAKLKAATIQVMAEAVAQDPAMKKVYESYSAFYEQVKKYHDISEKEYYLTR